MAAGENKNVFYLEYFAADFVGFSKNTIGFQSFLFFYGDNKTYRPELLSYGKGVILTIAAIRIVIVFARVCTAVRKGFGCGPQLF